MKDDSGILIRKHELELAGPTTLLLTVDAVIVHVDVQTFKAGTRAVGEVQRLCLWEERSPVDIEFEKRTFIPLRTGVIYEPARGEWLVHVGTVVASSGFAYHLYEVMSESEPVEAVTESQGRL